MTVCFSPDSLLFMNIKKSVFLGIFFFINFHGGALAAQLSLAQAQKIAAKAAEYAQSKKWSVSIAIVNSEGNLLYFERDPNSYSGSIESSMQKARSANAFQRPTSAFVDGIKQGRIGLVSVKMLWL